MRFLVALALSSLALASASTHHNNKHHSPALSEKELEAHFTTFVKTHNKKYTHDEFFNRFNTFKTNMEKIRIHNNSNQSFTMASNEFADQTWEEFRANKLGYKHIENPVARANNVADLDESTPLAASVDWRTKGVVTPVKNQGQCGSCWAFSTTGSTEGAVALKTGDLVSLSEQQLVDCSGSYGNQGCNGGLMDSAFEYIIANKGITAEASYPYTGVDGTCKTGKTAASKLTSYTDVKAGSEAALKVAVAKQPVSVAIEADQEAFQFYSSGILSGTCGQQLDHGVLVVGYGTQASKDYWIVKNSWGASWGEAGYIRLAYGINQCGLANQASFPVA